MKVKSEDNISPTAGIVNETGKNELDEKEILIELNEKTTKKTPMRRIPGCNYLLWSRGHVNGTENYQ